MTQLVATIHLPLWNHLQVEKTATPLQHHRPVDDGAAMVLQFDSTVRSLSIDTTNAAVVLGYFFFLLYKKNMHYPGFYIAPLTAKG